MISDPDSQHEVTRRIFICGFCNKIFAKEINMAEHLKTHVAATMQAAMERSSRARKRKTPSIDLGGDLKLEAAVCTIKVDLCSAPFVSDPAAVPSPTRAPLRNAAVCVPVSADDDATDSAHDERSSDDCGFCGDSPPMVASAGTASAGAAAKTPAATAATAAAAVFRDASTGLQLRTLPETQSHASCKCSRGASCIQAAKQLQQQQQQQRQQQQQQQRQQQQQQQQQRQSVLEDRMRRAAALRAAASAGGWSPLAADMPSLGTAGGAFRAPPARLVAAPRPPQRMPSPALLHYFPRAPGAIYHAAQAPAQLPQQRPPLPPFQYYPNPYYPCGTGQLPLVPQVIRIGAPRLAQRMPQAPPPS